MLAIDPGIHTGWAHGWNIHGIPHLECAGLGDGFSAYLDTQVIIEKPTVYPHTKVNPNNLITLAVQVGEYKHAAESVGALVALVEPRTWKGQVPKSVTEARVKRAFPNAKEFVRTVAPSLQNNVYDAMGLLLWGLLMSRTLGKMP